MAGDWLKFEVNTPEKQEVFSITVVMGWEDPDLTVGKLIKVWRWFDQHTIEGNAPSVSLALLDRVSGVSGFAQAMRDVGWLIEVEGGLSLPNFSRHNGKTAKKRALTAKRVASHKSNAPDNAKGNAASVSGALPREEKRREDIPTTSNEVVGSAQAKRGSKKCPASFVVTQELRSWAAENCPGVNLEAETAKLRDHTFGAARVDWDGTWRNWIRRCFELKKGNGRAPTRTSFDNTDYGQSGAL